MKICPKCQRFIKDKGFTQHFKYCSGKIFNDYKTCNYCGKNVLIKTKNSMSGHKAKCIKLKRYINSFLTKDFLYQNLIVKNYTSNYIAVYILKIPEISAGHIITKAHEFSIPIKTHQESCQIGRVLAKKTCLDKYGIGNVSQVDHIKEKKINTFLKHYGTTNVFKTDLFKANLKKYYLENYGVENVGQLGLSKSTGKRSKPHRIIENLLTEMNISFKSEVYGKFSKINDILKKNYSPIVDILIDDLKIVIEVNGDMWHANPKIYHDDDLISTWSGLKSAEEIRLIDNIRKDHIESFGYKVLIIWEFDILKNLHIVKQQLQSNLMEEKEKFADIKNKINI